MIFAILISHRRKKSRRIKWYQNYSSFYSVYAIHMSLDDGYNMRRNPAEMRCIQSEARMLFYENICIKHSCRHVMGIDQLPAGLEIGMLPSWDVS
jgi:hypothetical protein